MSTVYFTATPEALLKVLPGWLPPLDPPRSKRVKNPFKVGKWLDCPVVAPDGPWDAAARAAHTDAAKEFLLVDDSEPSMTLAEIGEILGGGDLDMLEPEMVNRRPLYGPRGAGSIVEASPIILEVARRTGLADGEARLAQRGGNAETLQAVFGFLHLADRECSVYAYVPRGWHHS